MKTILKLALALSLLLGGATCFFFSYQPKISIESLESKTIEGGPVFNKIKFLPGLKQDTWLMKQSHYGSEYPDHLWDEIKIVVDKKQKPYLVSYSQLMNNQEIEFTASCYTCHANGPRVIRPKTDSLSLTDKINVELMNLRIKTYGKVEINETSYRLKGQLRKVPLKFFADKEVKKLEIATCLKCHNSDSFLGRGNLLGQHRATIAHLTKTQQMPPWPYKLSEKEKRMLDEFLE